jgi:hypothetical protein
MANFFLQRMAPPFDTSQIPQLKMTEEQTWSSEDTQGRKVESPR